MDGAEAPDEVSAVDGDHFALGQQRGDDLQGYAVVGVVEDRDQHQVVGYIKVGVAGGQARSFVVDRLGHGQLDYAERAAFLVGGGVQAGQVLGQRGEVGVLAVGFHGGYDGVGADEAGDVIDVSVGIVAGDAAVEPDYFADPQVVGEDGFEAAAVEAGIARLLATQQALLGGEHGSVAVHVNAAAFEHDAVLLVLHDHGRLPGGKLEQRGDVGGKEGVLLPVGVLGPGVELPVSDGQRAGEVAELGALGGASEAAGVGVALAADEYRTGVAGPDAVGRPAVKRYLSEIRAHCSQNFLRLGFRLRVVHDDANLLDTGKLADDLGVDPGDGLEASGPVVGVVRPGDPGGGVGLPLGRHAVAERRRLERLGQRLGAGGKFRVSSFEFQVKKHSAVSNQHSANAKN